MNNKAVAYLRNSTKNQSEESMMIQRQKIEEASKVRGLTVEYWFPDRACSGRKSKRPNFEKMLNEARNGPTWSTILVHDYSRFSRNYKDAIKYLEELKSLGISVVSVTEDYDAYIKSIWKDNENYVKKVSHATREGLALKAKAGKHCGGKPLFGYDISPDKELVINEAEAIFVRQLFEMFIVGYSYKEIYDELKKDGLKHRQGLELKKHSLRGMLRNRKYIGEVTWRTTSADGEKVIIKSTCPAIVDELTFNKAQERINNSAGGCGTKSKKSRTLFSDSNRAVCGECGSILKVKQRTPTKGKRYCLYYCPNHIKGECKQKEVRARDIDVFAAVCITKLIFKQNIELFDTKVDKNERKEIKRMVVKHLIKQTNSHVRDLIEALDVRVVVNDNDIKIEMMREST